MEKVEFCGVCGDGECPEPHQQCILKETICSECRSVGWPAIEAALNKFREARAFANEPEWDGMPLPEAAKELLKVVRANPNQLPFRSIDQYLFLQDVKLARMIIYTGK